MSDAAFALDVPNGTYNITLTMGDRLEAHDKMGVFFEGYLDDIRSVQANQFTRPSYSVKVSDGQLTFGLRDLGGIDPYAIINGLEIS